MLSPLRLLLGACAVGWSTTVVPAADAPVLSHVTPGAVCPGHTTEVVLDGQRLDSTRATLRTSFPARVELIPAAGEEKSSAKVSPVTPAKKKSAKAANEVRFRVTLEPECPVGLGAIWFANESGISDPLLLLVDDLPSHAANRGGCAPPLGEAVELPVAIDGRTTAGRPDVYQFTLAAGQRILCEVSAQRLGSQLDPVLRLLDEEGAELLFVDDDASLGADWRFNYPCATAGRYRVEVRDIRYAGKDVPRGAG